MNWPWSNILWQLLKMVSDDRTNNAIECYSRNIPLNRAGFAQALAQAYQSSRLPGPPRRAGVRLRADRPTDRTYRSWRLTTAGPIEWLVSGVTCAAGATGEQFCRVPPSTGRRDVAGDGRRVRTQPPTPPAEIVTRCSPCYGGVFRRWIGERWLDWQSVECPGNIEHIIFLRLSRRCFARRDCRFFCSGFRKENVANGECCNCNQFTAVVQAPVSQAPPRISMVCFT